MKSHFGQIIFSILIVIFFTVFCWGIRNQFSQLHDAISKKMIIKTVEAKWWI